MQDIQLYQQIVDLTNPWRVKSVTLDRGSSEVRVEVECTEKVWACGDRGQRMHIHDYERRGWRHLDHGLGVCV